MKQEFICVVCPAGCHLVWDDGEVTGNSCERGEAYARAELTAPKRSVSSTVVLKGNPRHRRLPVRTSGPLNKELIKEAVRRLDDVEVEAPVKLGDVVLENLFGTRIDFVAARSVN